MNVCSVNGQVTHPVWPLVINGGDSLSFLYHKRHISAVRVSEEVRKSGYGASYDWTYAQTVIGQVVCFRPANAAALELPDTFIPVVKL